MTDILTKPRLRLSYVFMSSFFLISRKKNSLVLRFTSYIIMFFYFQMKKIPIKIFISSIFFCNLNCNMNHRWIISICILLHNHEILLLSFSSNLENFIPRMVYIYNRWIIVYLFIFFSFSHQSIMVIPNYSHDRRLIVTLELIGGPIDLN